MTDNPMTKRQLRQIQILALIAISVIFLAIRNLPILKDSAPKAPGEDYYTVVRVVDGDTIKIAGGERVRLIGIDTPEVHYSDKLLRDSKKSGRDIKTIQALGRKASDFTRGLCSGKKVRLEFDVDRRDRYGRLLAYVYLEDGTFVNAKIIEEGYAQVLTIPPNVKHADLFLRLQKDAREGRRGLWKR